MLHCKASLFFVSVAACVCIVWTQDLKWDRLNVTYRKFTAQPLTIAAAEKAGWTQDGWCNSAKSKSNFYLGNRFTLNGDNATRLLYDCDGFIAGIQATITPTATYPSSHQTPPWIPDEGGQYSVTAYFRDPEEICKCKKKCKHRLDKKPRIGDRLWIQIADFRHKKGISSKVMKIPSHAGGLKGTPWVEGTCVRAMGVHYHYNISLDFDCDYALPVFLLYDKQSRYLSGFGWGAALLVESNTWEKPPPSVFSRSMRPEVTPRCLPKLPQISVEHIYVVDPLKLLCS